jgi:MerR family transcriptional regulator, thiopeptide resistance regulator
LKEGSSVVYRIQQFATLAGVTVRTLRHYDRLCLLSPRHRTESGYRLYRIEDLAQLERILVLRYLGFTLRQIGELIEQLEHPPTGKSAAQQQTLAETLASQASVLRERRDGITRVLRAVENAQQTAVTGTPDWTLFQSILKEITMQDSTDWSKPYYSPEAQTAIEEGPKWTPELQAKTTADWNIMYADVEAAIARNLDPASAEARVLADRWMKLIGAFTQGNPEVLKGLNKLYADRENWPTEQKEAMQQRGPKPELMAWIRTVQAAHTPAK